MTTKEKPRYPIQFRTTKEIKDRLEKMAEKEDRSVSSLTRMIVYNYLKDIDSKKRA